MINDDLKLYPVYMFYSGRLQRADWIKTTENYDHYNWQIHHYIKKGNYKRNKAWYDERGIKQKLILLPVQCHLDLHNCLTNFEKKWGIARKELLYGAKF